MTKQKVIGLVLVNGIGLALLIFTALRTLDLIQLTLPLESQNLGYLALVAFDGGLVGWTVYHIWAARGGWQRGISLGMIGVSLIGVLIAFGTDTQYQAAARGTVATIDPELVSVAIWGMVGIIGLNIAAVVVMHLKDPDVQRMQAEEEARDKITDAALKQIASNAETLAAELAPRLGSQWISEMRAQFAGGLPVTVPVITGPASNVVHSEAPALPALANGKGRKGTVPNE